MTRTKKLLAGLAVAAAFGTVFAIVGLAPAKAADLGGNCCADLEERVAELEATTARKGDRKMSLTVFGQINESLLWVDAPGNTKTTITGNGNSQTRFGFKGEAKIGTGMTAGYLLEIGTASDTGVAGYGLGIRLAGGIGYRKEDDLANPGKKSATVNGSGSLVHVETGLFVNASYGATA